MIGAIGSMHSVRKEEIDQGHQLRVVTAVVTPTLTYVYGCEAWTLQARHKGHIQVTQMRLLSWIEGVSRLVRMRDVSFRGILKQEGVLDIYGEEAAAELEAQGRSNRVTKKVLMETFQEDALEEHPGRHGDVTLINSTLSIMHAYY